MLRCPHHPTDCTTRQAVCEEFEVPWPGKGIGMMSHSFTREEALFCNSRPDTIAPMPSA